MDIWKWFALSMMGRPSWPRLGRRGHVSTGRSGGGAAAGDTSATLVPLATLTGDVPVVGAVVGAPWAVPVVPAAAFTVADTPTAPPLVSPAGANRSQNYNALTPIHNLTQNYRINIVERSDSYDII